jgi:hypothetical protein
MVLPQPKGAAVAHVGQVAELQVGPKGRERVLIGSVADDSLSFHPPILAEAKALPLCPPRVILCQAVWTWQA